MLWLAHVWLWLRAAFEKLERLFDLVQTPEQAAEALAALSIDRTSRVRKEQHMLYPTHITTALFRVRYPWCRRVAP